MENKILLSIAILTYNRARCLENLLNNILPQTKELGGLIEVCISNNASTDNTREVVTNFKEKYPDLIKYNENKNNLGSDRNILKVMEMSSGDFIWTFGDDDSIADNGLSEVVNLIKRIDRKNTGLITVAFESYFIDKRTNQRVVCGSTLNKNKPEIFEMDKKDVIGIPFPNAGFITLLIFNNEVFKKVMKEEKEIVEKAIGTFYLHVILRSLMFLKYSYLNAIALNKLMVFQELPSYKFFVEDKFILQYQVQKKLNNLLLSYRYMNNIYAPSIIKRNNGLRRGFIIDMTVMRAFKNCNYFSYFGCLKLFFQQAMFMDALLFSFVFSILFLIPPIILVSLYKILLMVRYGKKWRAQWFLASNFFSITNKGIRRQTD